MHPKGMVDGRIDISSSDAAQRCSSRCSQGKQIVCEAGGCIKQKSILSSPSCFVLSNGRMHNRSHSRSFSQDRGQQFHRQLDIVPDVPWRRQGGRVGKAPREDTPVKGTSCLQRVGHIFYTETNIHIHAAFEAPLTPKSGSARGCHCPSVSTGAEHVFKETNRERSAR